MFLMNMKEILHLLAGKYHTVIVTRTPENKRRILAFGLENGMGIDGCATTHEPQEVRIPQLRETELDFVVCKYNTNIAVDCKNRLFVWGEDLNNVRLRKPRLVHQFASRVRQVALGRRHGIVTTLDNGLFGWGDGTYGELGLSEGLPAAVPVELPFFQGMWVEQVAAGARHSLVLDSLGNIFAMGDNSEDQCAISGRRASHPEKILKDFRAMQIYSGESHNVAVADDKAVYSWGGATINSSWAQQSTTESKLRLMEDLKRRKISLIELSYANTVVITG